jgi:hypothetical protein
MSRIHEQQLDDADTTEFERSLTERYGLLVGNKDLWTALSYRTPEAFRQAYGRGRLPIHVFALPGRRGKYALTRDLARWLDSLDGDVRPPALSPCEKPAR